MIRLVYQGCLGLVAPALAMAALSDQQRAQIDKITGAKGVYTAAEDVHKVSFPRNDRAGHAKVARLPPHVAAG